MIQNDPDGDPGLTRRRLVQAGGAAAVGLMLGAVPASGAVIAEQRYEVVVDRSLAIASARAVAPR